VTVVLDHTAPTRTRLRMLELELTGRCPLECRHCLTESSPRATHGTMTFED
jgi:MoaA/NifB/PqqE/SkfB family radical SAM enzyme